MKKNIILSILLFLIIVLLCCACGSKQTAEQPTAAAPATSNEPAPTNTPPFQMMDWTPTQQPADPINNGGK